ncbi:MAG: Antibiotic biosynthesis monooxygenase [Chitinophagaceae bacterium]|nr:Antibiotic biosynthesis monooxygenase [Chitinophagaceae bacterium]
MVVRLTRFSVSPDKAQEAKNVYQQEVVLEVKKQKGNTNVMLLEPADGSDEFISITGWENKADAEAYESSGKYKELVGKIKGLIGQAVLKTYNTQ